MVEEFIRAFGAPAAGMGLTFSFLAVLYRQNIAQQKSIRWLALQQLKDVATQVKYMNLPVEVFIARTDDVLKFLGDDTSNIMLDGLLKAATKWPN